MTWPHGWEINVRINSVIEDLSSRAVLVFCLFCLLDVILNSEVRMEDRQAEIGYHLGEL